MKRTALVVAAAVWAVTIPLPATSMDHGSMSTTQGRGMMDQGVLAHEEAVDGVKAVFKVMDMKTAMHGMDMHESMQGTHHVMAAFADGKTGKALTMGEVRAKVIGPDSTEQVKDLTGMGGHFGADFDLSKPGRYGIMVKFKVGDGKVRSAKFWYVVK
jgi:hypothetical protein